MGTALTIVPMYSEKVTITDKLINTILSPFDKVFSKQNTGCEDNYIQVLGYGKDIGNLSEKWVKYFYFAVHIKIFEILSTVYDGYEAQKEHTFVNVDNRLDDLFLELLKCWKQFDKYPFIQKLKLGNYKGFSSLNSNVPNQKQLWLACKKAFVADISELPQIPTITLSNDLKLAFLEADKLIAEHKTKKNKVLFGEGVLEYRNLKINLNSCTLSINNSQPIPISTKTKEYSLLILLLQNTGTVVTYKQIAEHLELNNYTESVDTDVKRYIQGMKRDLGIKLSALGFSKKEANTVRSYISFVRNIGAIINS